MLDILLENTLDIFLEALPFLFFGFFVAGLLRSFVPNKLISKYLGKDDYLSPIKATVLGAPIPLCSCSVIPVAVSLRRGGAGRGALSSFLVSAPETGVDSLSISYAMLGPFIMISRLISSLFTSIITGFAVMFFTKSIPLAKLKDFDCSKKSDDDNKVVVIKKNIFTRFLDGQRYSFTVLLDDSLKWVLLALCFTVILKTYVPEDFFLYYGDGLLAMLIMVIVSFPMYICASASTPIAAGLLLVGISPGAALVFMLTGPASNFATIGIISNIINKRASIIYLICVVVLSVLSGLLLNFIVDYYNIDIMSQVRKEEILPTWLSLVTTIWVLLASVKPLRKYLGLVT